MEDLTVIILTKNEELNIENCINSVKPIAKRIVVMDSYSSDRTTEIAETLGAEIYQNTFEYHAKQYNTAIKLANPTSRWILRLDADERLTSESRSEIQSFIRNNENTNVNGFVLRFEVVFMGKKLRHGGIYPFRKMLLYRNGHAIMEDRMMDEHLVLLDGDMQYAKADSEHHDYKDLTRFIEKHNQYATKEALQYFNNDGQTRRGLAKRSRIKRFVKYAIYYKLPMYLRAKLYYFYRYYLLLGFLDGREGKLYAFFQAYWYRVLVDGKILELKKGNK